MKVSGVIIIITTSQVTPALDCLDMGRRGNLDSKDPRTRRTLLCFLFPILFRGTLRRSSSRKTADAEAAWVNYELNVGRMLSGDLRPLARRGKPARGRWGKSLHCLSSNTVRSGRIVYDTFADPLTALPKTSCEEIRDGFKGTLIGHVTLNQRHVQVIYICVFVRS